MSVTVTPHLNFNGQGRHALGFYRSVFGGQSTLVTYQDVGNVKDPGDADRIMWGQVESENGFRIHGLRRCRGNAPAPR